MRFANPEFLWLLLPVLVAALYVRFFRTHDLPSFRLSSAKLVQGALGASKLLSGIQGLGYLRALSLVLIVIGLARPQRGLKSEEMTTKATDILICLDASSSMLVNDFKPDRFVVAKQVVQDFIKGREHDRIGLVLFAEYAVTQCPLTTDKNALLSIVEQLQVGGIPANQTAIGVGLATSVNRIKDSAAKSKVIALVTDGSNNAGSIYPLTAAKTAAAFGIKVYAIGVGSTEGGMMPIDDPRFGRRMVPVKSELDEETLMKIAAETNGRYFRAKDPEALKKIFIEIDALEKTDIKVREYVDYEELFLWPLLLALFFIFIELGAAKTIYRTLP